MNATENASAAAECAPSTLEFAALPALGNELAGGTFAGLTTSLSNMHFAVILLSPSKRRITWEMADEWAVSLGGKLPTRCEANLLFANLGPPAINLKPGCHWTSETYGRSHAWYCDFGRDHGFQGTVPKCSEANAIAVRLIPIVSDPLNHCKAATMNTAAIKTIEVKKAELKSLITLNAEVNSFNADSPSCPIELSPGEHYVGRVSEDMGKAGYHLVLLPGCARYVDFEEAKEWGARKGGDLPTLNELSLIFDELGPDDIDYRSHWSCQAVEQEERYAWAYKPHPIADCRMTLKNRKVFAVAVRRVSA